MDNNNPQPVAGNPIPPTETPQQPIQQQPQSPLNQISGIPPVVDTVASEGGSGKKIFLFLILGTLIIALTVGAIYYYMNFMQTSKTTQAPVTSQSNSAPADSAVAGVTSIETELNAVNINSLDDAMTEIDKNINQL